MAVTVRTVSCTVTFDSVSMGPIVIGARGQISADGGWPTCSVFLTEYPTDTPGTPGGNRIDEENPLVVAAGAGNNVTRFTGMVRRFRSSGFPKGIEMVAMGTLAYANEWSPAEDIEFSDVFPSGAADEDIIQWVLDHVPNVTYTSADIDGSGATLGYRDPVIVGPPNGAPEAFDWKKGVSAWQYIQALDRATLYRTYQSRDGSILRVQMIGHPNTTEDFTFVNEDVLDGATGSRDTERTRNAVVVLGHDYGDGLGPVLNGSGTFGSNDFQGDGSDPDLRHVEVYQSDLIESGTDPDDDSWDGAPGIRADEVATAILPDVNKEFVDASVPSWRDDTHGPGLTCLLDCLDRLSIGEPMWVQAYAWEVGERGWQSNYTLSGGGLPIAQTPPEV